jgi:small-conductance mechanosensitive channel
MMRDVTELLRVDDDLDVADSFDQALLRITNGARAVVADDETAKKLLVALGLTETEADDQLRVSRGPLA